MDKITLIIILIIILIIVGNLMPRNENFALPPPPPPVYLYNEYHKLYLHIMDINNELKLHLMKDKPDEGQFFIDRSGNIKYGTKYIINIDNSKLKNLESISIGLVDIIGISTFTIENNYITTGKTTNKTHVLTINNNRAFDIIDIDTDPFTFTSDKDKFMTFK